MRTQRLLLPLLLLLSTAVPMWSQWTQLPEPSGGEIRSLAVRGISAFAVNASGTLYGNNGANWRATKSLRPQEVFCLNTIYFADDTGILLRSSDNGATWQETNLEQSVIRMIQSSSAFLASDYKAVYRSTDNGSTWDTISNFGDGVSLLDIDADGEYIYTLLFDTQGTRLMRLHEDSTTWTQVGTLPALLGWATKVEAVDGTIYLHFDMQGIHRSVDNGATWTPTNAGLPEQLNTLTVMDFLAIRSGLFATTSQGVYKYKNEQWHRVLSERYAKIVSTNSSDIGELWIANINGIYNGGVEGEQWVSVNAGLNAQTVRDIAPVGDVLLSATPSGMFRTTDHGMTWQQRFSTPTVSFATEGNTTVVLHDNMEPGVSRSTDGGITWVAATAGLEEPFIDNAAIAVSDGVWYLGVNNGQNVGAWRSTNNGASWENASTGLRLSNDEDPLPVHAIAADGSYVVASTSLGMYWSDNRGGSWQASNLQAEGGDIWPVIFASGRFFAANHDTLYSSADNGRTWSVEPINQDPESPILEIAALDDAIVVLAESYLASGNHPTQGWMLRNGTWSTITERLPENVRLLNLSAFGDRLYAGTWGDGIWRASKAEVLGETSSAPEHSINAFKLSAYPNPVSDDARIHFTVERPSHVVIDLVNPLGELVQTLFEGHVPEGDHTLLFDAKELLAGIWFYRLSVDRESRTEKVVKR